MKHNYLANRYFTDGQFQCYELLHSSKVMAETNTLYRKYEFKSTTH